MSQLSGFVALRFNRRAVGCRAIMQPTSDKRGYKPKVGSAKTPPDKGRVLNLLAEHNIPLDKAQSLLAVFSRMTYMKGRCYQIGQRDLDRLAAIADRFKRLATGLGLAPHPDEDFESIKYILEDRGPSYVENRSNDWQTDAVWRLADWWRDNTGTPYRKTVKQGTKQSPSISFTLKALDIWGNSIPAATLRDWISRARLK